MTKQQLNIRITKLARHQLDHLVEQIGDTEGAIVCLALDRLHQVEIATVSQRAGCPSCNERRVDYLAWDECINQVTCQTCGVVYQP